MKQKTTGLSVEAILGTDDPTEPVLSGSRGLALAVLRQNPDGVPAKLVASRLNVAPRHAVDLLERLCNSREAYSRKIPGIAAKLYYPNGRLIHKYLQESRPIGDQIFRLSFHEGRTKPRLRIQERHFTLLEGEVLEGSVFVDFDGVESFVSFLQEMLQKFNQFKAEKEGAK